MKQRIKAFKNNWGLLLLGAILMAAGVLILLYPAASMKTLCCITAATTALVGMALMINGLSGEKRQWKYVLFLVCGAMTFVAGILLFFAPENVFLFYTAIVGLLLVLNGGFGMQSVVLSRRSKTKAWWVKLPLSLLVITGGFLCIRLQNVSVGTLTTVFGLTLTFAGALDFLSFLTPSMQLQAVGRVEAKPSASESIPKE